MYASRPYNAGRRYCDKFICLGPLPAPRRGQSDITAQYVKVYGEPRPGSRVILRIVQQVNGWRNLPQRIETVFRPDQAPTAQPNLRRALAPAPITSRDTHRIPTGYPPDALRIPPGVPAGIRLYPLVCPWTPCLTSNCPPAQ